MPESASRRISQKYLAFGVVAAAVISLLAAYLLGAFEKRGKINANDICRNVPNRQETAMVFNSILPQSAQYHFRETWHPETDWSFKSNCSTRGEGDKALFSLTAEMGSARPWQQWAETEIPPNDGGKITYFDAGLKGISNAEVAAIWLPCYAHEETSKQPWSMSVFADALKPLEASDEEARQTLIDLATSFARQAHEDAKCDLPSKLPSSTAIR